MSNVPPERGPDWMDDPTYDGGNNLSQDELTELRQAFDPFAIDPDRPRLDHAAHGH